MNTSTDPGPVLLDDVPLARGVRLSGPVDKARPILTALGLTGPVREADGNGLLVEHEGLKVEVTTGAEPGQPGTIPPRLANMIWGDRTTTTFLADAARLPGFDGPDGLPGVELTCLYDGEAAASLAGVAPWLIQLDRDHTLAHHLFDDTGTFWALWPHGAGIFLRSEEPLGTLRRSLRRFTRLRNGDVWSFLRMAEPRMLLPLLLGLSPAMRGQFFDGIDAMIAIDPEEQLIVHAVCTDPAIRSAIVLEPGTRQVLEAATRARFAGDAERFCRETLVQYPVPKDPRRFARAAMQRAREAGLHDRQAVLLAVAAAWSAGASDWTATQRALTDDVQRTQIEKGRALLRRAVSLYDVSQRQSGLG